MIKKNLLVLCLITTLVGCSNPAIKDKTEEKQTNSEIFHVLSSLENKDLEFLFTDFANSEGISMEFEYAGTLDIKAILETKPTEYDAVFASNDIWLYMIKNSPIKYAKPTSINPIVYGIPKDKAEELGFVDKDVYMKDIMSAINNKKADFIIPSVTSTDSGASAYLGILQTLAGNPEILTEDMLNDEQLQEQLRDFMKGMKRSSGDLAYTIQLLKNDISDLGAIDYEANLIKINKELISDNKEPLQIVYPLDGVSLANSPLGYIDNKDEKKLETFKKLQKHFLTNDTQDILTQTGRRGGYGGLVPYAKSDIFRKDWGIDTTKYISPVKYPSENMINKSLELYQELFRRPSYTIFCLDFSGSMYNEGEKELRSAMDYILDPSKASTSYLQFTPKDTVVIIPFNNEVQGIRVIENENIEKAAELMNSIGESDGGTDMYIAASAALDYAKQIDTEKYSVSIVIMTDGRSTTMNKKQFEKNYIKSKINTPILSIMFGEATSEQLDELATLSNGKVFDGHKDLITTFKEVRGYN